MFGGRIVIRKFDTPRDLMSLAEPVVVNCTGLGSFTLFDDKELVPIKGQLTALVAQPEVTYRAGGRTANGGNASMSSRSDGITSATCRSAATGRSNRIRTCCSATCRRRLISSPGCGRRRPARA